MISNIFEKLAKSKTINNALDYIETNPANAARMLLMANVAKDVINCGFYTYQSLNNKDIPEEKRNFVAALDLSNGILNIGTQLLAGLWFTTKSVQAKICNGLFGKVANNYERFIKNNYPKIDNQDLQAKIQRSIDHQKIFGKCKSGFTAISTVVITTILAKRVVVPFLATPIASWFKNKYMNKKPNTPEKPEQNQIKTLNPNKVQSPVHSAVKQVPRPGSSERFHNDAYRAPLFNNP